MGVGIGGDYPISAVISSEFSSVHIRGRVMAAVFANQGWGSFIGSLVTLIVLACYEHVMNAEGETSKVDGGESVCHTLCYTVLRDMVLVWRIVIGLSLLPAFGTLYQRLTLPESTRYLKSRKVNEEEAVEVEKKPEVDEKAASSSSSNDGSDTPGVPEARKAHFSGKCFE